MALVTDGILTQKLPWGLVLIGVFLTFAIELMGLQSLPIAVGVYLPISTSCRDVRRRRGALAGGAAIARSRALHRGGRVGAGRAVLQRAHRRRRHRRRRHRRHGGGAGEPGPRRRRCRRPTTWRTWRVCRGRWAASRPATSRRFWSSPLWAPCSTGSPAAEMPPGAPVSPAISARIIHAALVLGVCCSGGSPGTSARWRPMPSRRCPTGACCTWRLVLVSAVLFGAAAFTAGRLTRSDRGPVAGRMVAAPTWAGRW